MAELEISFLLPLPGWPCVRFESDYSYESARLLVGDQVVVRARTRAELERGVCGSVPEHGVPILLQLVHLPGKYEVQVEVAGQVARREDTLRARPTRSAWTHACLALAGSAAGFIASYLYLLKAASMQSDWALKMGNHMLGWHLLLTFTLFPASVWGQRAGIRAVQLVSLVFFLIHAGIAIANMLPNAGAAGDDTWIALFNATSGLFFLTATIYGNRAWRDMDPVAALRVGRA